MKSCESKVFALCLNYRTKPHLDFTVYGRPKFNDVGTIFETDCTSKALLYANSAQGK